MNTSRTTTYTVYIVTCKKERKVVKQRIKFRLMYTGSHVIWRSTPDQIFGRNVLAKYWADCFVQNQFPYGKAYSEHV